MLQIPTYREALDRHETPLDVFVSRWEPVNHASDKKTFREDLAALIAYIEAAQHRVQPTGRDVRRIWEDTPGSDDPNVVEFKPPTSG